MPSIKLDGRKLTIKRNDGSVLDCRVESEFTNLEKVLLSYLLDLDERVNSIAESSNQSLSIKLIEGDEVNAWVTKPWGRLTLNFSGLNKIDELATKINILESKLKMICNELDISYDE